MMKKLLAVLLVLTVVLGMSTITVFAEDVADDATVGLIGLQVLDTERDLIYPLKPQFDTDIFEYEVNVLNYVGYVQVQPTADAEGVFITVNGVEVAGGDWSDYIPLNIGKNIVTVKVSDNNGENSPNECEYTLIIYRADVDKHEHPTFVEITEIPEDPDIPDTPDTPDIPDTPDTSDTPDSPDIPNTDNSTHSDLWLAVTVIFSIGFLSVGLFYRKKTFSTDDR